MAWGRRRRFNRQPRPKEFTKNIPKFTIRATEAQVLETVRSIMDFVNVKLNGINFQFMTEGIAHINFKTMEMNLNRRIQQSPSAFLEFVVGHEGGHVRTFPVSFSWWMYYIALAKQKGFDNPHFAANVVADIFTNDWNMQFAPWGKSFANQARRFYRTDPERQKKAFTEEEKIANENFHKKHSHEHNPNSIWRFLCFTMQNRVKELYENDKWETKFFDQDEEDAYHLAFDEGPMSLKDRFGKILDKMEKFKKSPAGGEKPGPNGLPYHIFDASLPNKPMSTEDYELWKQCIGDLDPNAVQWAMQEAARNANSSEARKALFDVASIMAFKHLMLAEDEGQAKARVSMGPKVERKWRPTDPVVDLDARATYMRSGILLPGLTTIKRIRGIKREEEQSGKGTLFLVFDTSGSMDSLLGPMMMLGWAAVLGAKRQGHRAALMTFAGYHEQDYLVPPGESWEALKDALASLEATGGTYLGAALAKVVEETRRTKRKPTCLILTDAGIYDVPQTLGNLRILKSLGGRAIVTVPSECMGYDWLKQGVNQGVMKLFLADNFGSSNQALKEVLA